MSSQLKFSLAFLLVGMVINEGAFSALLPVCERTPAVKQALELLLKKSCETIGESDLLTVTRLAVQRKNVTKFHADDFSGLKNLDILNIRSNPYTELPEGLLKDLPRLTTLVIISTKLRHFPDDFLEHNPEIKNLHLFRNEVRSISESVFARLEKARGLKDIDLDGTLQPAEKERLLKLFPEGGSVNLSLIGG
jgi:Leucine-rich repeat (LRR) protein